MGYDDEEEEEEGGCEARGCAHSNSRWYFGDVSY